MLTDAQKRTKKKWYLKHRHTEKYIKDHKARCLRYYYEHHEIEKEKGLKRYYNDKEGAMENQRLYRARVKNTPKYKTTKSNCDRVWRYGITKTQYEEMKSNQNNKCAICYNPLELGRKTHIDHNHKTNKVRGILCRRCNLLVGYANDSIDILQNTIDYLRIRDA